MENEQLLILVVILLLLTNLYTAWLVLRAERKQAEYQPVEFYRGFYAARLLAQPGRFNTCRKLTHLAITERLDRVCLPGWRWPLPRAYRCHGRRQF
ncbi:MAG: hypothetical protein DPW09_42790 [Anaerolineae bacterium]|nr:hypothetical protein [Anaerolineales bacterium]MCQ3980190.1 hypothetical protein [Anaerolineae bacterium]